MIDLKKLEKINKSILDNNDDKELLIKNFKNMLDVLNQIESQFEKTYEVATNVEQTIPFIHAIAINSNKEFSKRKLIRSTERIKYFIELRNNLINKALRKLNSKAPINLLIQKHYKTIGLYDNNEISILRGDGTRSSAAVMETCCKTPSALETTTVDEITYLLFKNFVFTEYIEYLEKKLNDKEILDEIHDEYPTFLKDFKDTLNDLYGELNESLLLVQNYAQISTSVYNTCKKYYNI